MDALQLVNTHVKLLAFDFLTLKPIPHEPTVFSRKGRRLSRAETVGIVVTRDFKPNRFIKFDIDDGTGCIPCILWLNQESSHHFSRRCPSQVRVIAQMAADFASQVQLGVIARVRGRITSYRGLSFKSWMYDICNDWEQYNLSKHCSHWKNTLQYNTLCSNT